MILRPSGRFSISMTTNAGPGASTSKYDAETHAQAQAQIRAGVPAEHVAANLGLPARTVSHWALRWRQIAANEGDREMIDNEYRISLRSDEMIHDALDELAAEPSKLKHLMMLNVLRGTMTDKIIARQRIGANTGPQGTFVVVQINNAEPVTIESTHHTIDDTTTDAPHVPTTDITTQ